MPAHLCHPGELNELYEQHGVNTVLPRTHHPDLDQVPAKHPTRAFASIIHYQLRKHMFTKFATSQTDIADLFQVERKKFFASITGREYKAGKKHIYMYMYIYIIHVTYFNFIFILHWLRMRECKSVICTYVLTIVILFLFQKKKKKKHLSFSLGKNSKVMPQLPCYLSFLLGKGGKPLYLKPY